MLLNRFTLAQSSVSDLRIGFLLDRAGVERLQELPLLGKLHSFVIDL